MRIGLFIALAVSVATPAEATVSDTVQSGRWDAFQGIAVDGNQVCGVGTSWSDGRTFLIKVFGSNPEFIVQLVKPSWAVPAGTQISVVISFGAFAPFSLSATGNQTLVQVAVDPSEGYAFAKEFVVSSTFAISFPSGSEPVWGGSLSGSGAVGNAMLACINMLPGHTPSQPFSAQPQAPTQPSQPFQQQSSQAPPTPLTPPVGDGLNHI